MPSTPLASPQVVSRRFASFRVVKSSVSTGHAGFWSGFDSRAAPPARISRRFGWLISTRAAEESAEGDYPARPADARPTRWCQHGWSGIAKDAIPPTGTYANPYANQANTGRLSGNVRRCPQASKIASELQGSATSSGRQSTCVNPTFIAGVKWSQVQILSARQILAQIRGILTCRISAENPRTLPGYAAQRIAQRGRRTCPHPSSA